MTSTAASSDLRRKMMLLAIWPSWMPSASAACCAVRAASSSITGACGWSWSRSAAVTRCTPSGKLSIQVSNASPGNTAVCWYEMVSPNLIAGMEPSSLLKEYGRSVGLPALAFDGHGCARLRFDSGAEVNLEVDPSGDWIHMYAVLGPVPPGA